MSSISNFAQPISTIAIPIASVLLAAALVPYNKALALCVLPALVAHAVYNVEESTIAGFFVSLAFVGALRVSAVVQYPALGQNFGVRMVSFSFIPLFTSAEAIHASESLGRVYAKALTAALGPLVAAAGLFHGVKMIFSAETLRTSPFLSAGLIGIIAAVGLCALDGLYAFTFAYPAKIRFKNKIQNSPLQSTTLQEFWGRRWNTSIGQALRFGVFDVMHFRFGYGRGTSTVLTFAVSGMLHACQFAAWKRSRSEMCSVFLFFLIQGPLIWLERSLGVAGWRFEWAQRVWTWGTLLLTSPLLMGPLAEVHQVW